METPGNRGFLVVGGGERMDWFMRRAFGSAQANELYNNRLKREFGLSGAEGPSSDVFPSP